MRHGGVLDVHLRVALAPLHGVDGLQARRVGVRGHAVLSQGHCSQDDGRYKCDCVAHDDKTWGQKNIKVNVEGSEVFNLNFLETRLFPFKKPSN